MESPVGAVSTDASTSDDTFLMPSVGNRRGWWVVDAGLVCGRGCEWVFNITSEISTFLSHDLTVFVSSYRLALSCTYSIT